MDEKNDAKMEQTEQDQDNDPMPNSTDVTPQDSPPVAQSKSQVNKGISFSLRIIQEHICTT